MTTVTMATDRDDLLAPADRAQELRDVARNAVSWDLAPRQICDLELLLNGGFAPLRTFLGEEDYVRVRDEMRLADGTLWPIPIVLDVDEATAEKLTPGEPLALRDPQGVMLALLHVSEIYRPDRQAEVLAVYGTADTNHPGVAAILERTNPVYVSGELEGVELPTHHDFLVLRQTPAQVRDEIARKGWRRVVAFQTRNPIHRAHFELTRRAAESIDGGLLIHPVVGMTKPGDVDHYTRVRCYEALMPRYPDEALLSLLPLSMRMGGPREVLLHALIRRNYGCTHLIVGRDHAGPGVDKNGKPYYEPYEAQEMLRKHQEEIGIEMVPFPMLVYVEEIDDFVPQNEVPQGLQAKSISGTQLRDLLEKGDDIPEWFTFPEVAAQLRQRYGSRRDHGITIFFTGLSGSGKSTIANVLLVKLLEAGGRKVSLFDGDLVRKHLSSELGFSREHRELNIRRVGFVAGEVAQAGGISICALIAPYDGPRKEARAMSELHGKFLLVHVSTPLDVCESRDRKGLYAKARAGIVKEFTGISDPYEIPDDADLVIDATSTTPEESAAQVLEVLHDEGYLARE